MEFLITKFPLSFSFIFVIFLTYSPQYFVTYLPHVNYYFVHFNVLSVLITSQHLLDWITLHDIHGETPDPHKRQMLCCPVYIIVEETLHEKKYEQS